MPALFPRCEISRTIKAAGFVVGLSLTAVACKSATMSSGAAPTASQTRAAGTSSGANANGSVTGANGGGSVATVASPIGIGSGLATGTTPGSTNSANAANGGGLGSPSTTFGQGSAATLATPTEGTGGSLTVTKTIGGIPIEDKGSVLTITRINQDGSQAAPITVPFTAGSSGSVEVPNFCNPAGAPTQAQVQISAGGGNASTTTPTTSSVSFDPTTCILSDLLSGGKGDTFNLTCPNGPVQVVSP